MPTDLNNGGATLTSRQYIFPNRSNPCSDDSEQAKHCKTFTEKRKKKSIFFFFILQKKFPIDCILVSETSLGSITLSFPKASQEDKDASLLTLKHGRTLTLI